MGLCKLILTIIIIKVLNGYLAAVLFKVKTVDSYTAVIISFGIVKSWYKCDIFLPKSEAEDSKSNIMLVEGFEWLLSEYNNTLSNSSIKPLASKISYVATHDLIGYYCELELKLFL